MCCHQKCFFLSDNAGHQSFAHDSSQFDSSNTYIPSEDVVPIFDATPQNQIPPVPPTVVHR